MLSAKLNQLPAGKCNRWSNADDMCLIAKWLQYLVNILFYNYATDHDIVYNVKK